MSWDWNMVTNRTIEEAIGRVARKCRTADEKRAFLHVLQWLTCGDFPPRDKLAEEEQTHG
jgi:hypothetical protein